MIGIPFTKKYNEQRYTVEPFNTHQREKQKRAVFDTLYLLQQMAADSNSR
jgi:hypothetical protein